MKLRELPEHDAQALLEQCPTYARTHALTKKHLTLSIYLTFVNACEWVEKFGSAMNETAATAGGSRHAGLRPDNPPHLQEVS